MRKSLAEREMEVLEFRYEFFPSNQRVFCIGINTYMKITISLVRIMRFSLISFICCLHTFAFILPASVAHSSTKWKIVLREALNALETKSGLHDRAFTFIYSVHGYR